MKTSKNIIKHLYTDFGALAMAHDPKLNNRPSLPLPKRIRSFWKGWNPPNYPVAFRGGVWREAQAGKIGVREAASGRGYLLSPRKVPVVEFLFFF